MLNEDEHDHLNEDDDKLFVLINNTINEWKCSIEKRIKNVLESVKKGPLWKVHKFMVNDEEYQGVSHEPLPLGMFYILLCIARGCLKYICFICFICFANSHRNTVFFCIYFRICNASKEET